MSTSSLVINADQTGLSYTADLNKALEAINTCHSGAVAPTNDVFAGKFWLDTSGTNPVLRIYRNGWKPLFTLNSTNVDLDINNITAADIDCSTLDVTGNISGSNSTVASFGNADELTLYHNGTDSFLKDTSGNLRVSSNQLNLQSATGENYLSATNNAGVSLYHDNSTRLSTTTAGVSITGTATAGAFSGDGSSLTNVYPVQARAVWESGSSTTLGVVTPADVKASVISNAPQYNQPNESGNVGTYAMLFFTTNVYAGSNYSGFQYSGISRSAGNNLTVEAGSTAPGTWKAMGSMYSGFNVGRTTIFLRIS